MQLLIRNIRQLVTVAARGKKVKTGPAMKDLGILEQATVFVEDGTIRWVGPSADFRETVDPSCHEIDGSSHTVLPGFVDAHTHLVFGGSRENEFAWRSGGMAYQEIAERGGGILSTMQATRKASKRDLLKSGARRLEEMMRHGTTTVEVKSGYGLDEDSEIKLMEVIHELARDHFAEVVPTFLGAHAIPPEFTTAPDAYVNLVCTRLLPYIAQRHLATFCDVFCEKGYFTVAQTRQIFLQARANGLKLKIHADELNNVGASELGAEMHVVSADHLEHVTDEGILRLKESGTVAVLLPGVSFFLNHAYAPARRIVDAGVPVAIASDFNPGSCMSFSMPLMMTIACTHMALAPEEAITASTLNAAAALSLSERLGSIETGKQADMVLCEIPNYAYLPYHFGTNHVSKVIKKGVILEF